MTRYKIICPNCGAELIPTCPEALIWELCPSCRQHVWDVYDLMLAERSTTEQEPRHIGMLRIDS